MMDTGYLLAQAAPTGGGVGGTGDWLVWGVVLLGVAVALFFVEAFLPTGGVVGALSGVCAVAGVVMLFRVDTTLGLVGAMVCLVLLPFGVVFALKLWPNTPLARWVVLEDRQSRRRGGGEAADGQRAGGAGGEGEEKDGAGVAVGDTGRTLTPMYPVGTCLIGGQRIEGLSRRGALEAGVAVRVVEVDGSEVYVEAV